MPSITRRALLAAGAGTAITAGSYGAYRPHRGATAATFDPWEPAPGTWPLPRYDHANTAHNPNASPPREAYVGGQDGTLRAVDPESGRRWRVDGALPALGDGRLYAADAPLDGIVAYGERTGLDRRLTVGPKRVWSGGPTDGFPRRPAVADGRVVLGTVAEGGGVLVAVDLSTGEWRWRDAVDWRASTPVVGGETLVVAGAVREGGERAGGGVRAYDAASGEPLWTRGFDAGPTGVALVDDRVFVTVGADLYALR
jgi:outer membrane protein assembly factor BamB